MTSDEEREYQTEAISCDICDHEFREEPLYTLDSRFYDELLDYANRIDCCLKCWGESDEKLESLLIPRFHYTLGFPDEPNTMLYIAARSRDKLYNQLKYQNPYGQKGLRQLFVLESPSVDVKPAK